MFRMQSQSPTAPLPFISRFESWEVQEGDEVIVPSLTFVATVNAVRYVQATPVFCDIRGPDDLNIDPDQIESLITKKTRAIVVMHYGGFPCDMDRILDLARKPRTARRRGCLPRTALGVPRTQARSNRRRCMLQLLLQ